MIFEEQEFQQMLGRVRQNFPARTATIDINAYLPEDYHPFLSKYTADNAFRSALSQASSLFYRMNNATVNAYNHAGKTDHPRKQPMGIGSHSHVTLLISRPILLSETHDIPPHVSLMGYGGRQDVFLQNAPLQLSFDRAPEKYKFGQLELPDIPIYLKFLPQVSAYSMRQSVSNLAFYTACSAVSMCVSQHVCNMKIHDCKFMGDGVGIMLDPRKAWSEDLDIQRCHFEQCDVGVYGVLGNHCNIRDNRFLNCGVSVWCMNSNRLDISGNRLQGLSSMKPKADTAFVLQGAEITVWHNIVYEHELFALFNGNVSMLANTWHPANKNDDRDIIQVKYDWRNNLDTSLTNPALLKMGQGLSGTNVGEGISLFRDNMRYVTNNITREMKITKV